MRHPTEGVLRRLLDDPAAVSDPDRQHVVDCTTCLRELTAVRRDATLVASALSPGSAPEVDVAAAWRRLSASSATGRQPSTPRAAAGRTTGLLRRPAAAALAVALVLTGAGTAAANDWLQVFRTEQVAPVGITTADLVALPDLEAYGELEITEQPAVRSVSDAALAAAQSGLDVPEVSDLPAGIVDGPVHQVGSRASATFTYAHERAARAAAEAGQALPPPPPGVDGARIRLEAGPGVATIWSSASGAPALIVGRAVAPTAFSSGVRFEVLRDHLLSLPGFPDDVAAQLRTFAADGSTLPLPVPADQVTSRQAEVAGEQATVLVTRDRALAAVVWVEEGVVTVVAGALDAEELLTVAWGLG